MAIIISSVLEVRTHNCFFRKGIFWHIFLALFLFLISVLSLSMHSSDLRESLWQNKTEYFFLPSVSIIVIKYKKESYLKSVPLPLFLVTVFFPSSLYVIYYYPFTFLPQFYDNDIVQCDILRINAFSFLLKNFHKPTSPRANSLYISFTPDTSETNSELLLNLCKNTRTWHSPIFKESNCYLRNVSVT